MKNPIITLTTLAFLGLSTLHAQVKVGDNPTSIDASAVLEVESNTQGFLPPRMTTAQRDIIGSPVEGLTIYNIDNKCLEFFNVNHEWISACDGSVVTTPPAPVVISANGREWMERNLGASRVAQSFDDVHAFGDLYQWGRAADGHEKRNSLIYSDVANTQFGVGNFNNNPANAWYGRFVTRSSSVIPNWVDNRILNINNPWQDINGNNINNPCPTGYRLPTEAEWNVERNSWTNVSTNPRDAAFASPLKLPAAGARNGENGNLVAVNEGRYWSSTIPNNQCTSCYARRFAFNDSNLFGFFTVGRSPGSSVRCIKD